MRLSLKLDIAANNPTEMLAAIEPEFKQARTDRSEIKLKKSAKKLTAVISAEDIVAMKASINSILKLAEVYEKTRKVGKND